MGSSLISSVLFRKQSPCHLETHVLSVARRLFGWHRLRKAVDQLEQHHWSQSHHPSRTGCHQSTPTWGLSVAHPLLGSQMLSIVTDQVTERVFQTQTRCRKSWRLASTTKSLDRAAAVSSLGALLADQMLWKPHLRSWVQQLHQMKRTRRHPHLEVAVVAVKELR